MSLKKLSTIFTATLLTLAFSMNAQAEISLGKTDAQKYDNLYENGQEYTDKDEFSVTLAAGAITYSDDTRFGAVGEVTANLGSGIALGCEGEYTISDGDEFGNDDFVTFSCFGQYKILKAFSLRVGVGETYSDFDDFDVVYLKGIVHLNKVVKGLNLQGEFGLVREENQIFNEGNTNGIAALKYVFK